VKSPDLLHTLRRGLAAVAEPSRAPQMQAYMKSAMPYHGVPATRMRQVCRKKTQTVRRDRPKMLAWSRSKDVWKRRSAILCQIQLKKETDLDLLYSCIEPSLDSPEFLLRKAIGWALRQYAWTDPKKVCRYVDQHAGVLSNLSKREALKNIGGEGAIAPSRTRRIGSRTR